MRGLRLDQAALQAPSEAQGPLSQLCFLWAFAIRLHDACKAHLPDHVPHLCLRPPPHGGPISPPCRTAAAPGAAPGRRAHSQQEVPAFRGGVSLEGPCPCACFFRASCALRLLPVAHGQEAWVGQELRHKRPQPCIVAPVPADSLASQILALPPYPGMPT